MVLNRCLIRVVVRRATERTFYLGLKLVEVDAQYVPNAPPIPCHRIFPIHILTPIPWPSYIQQAYLSNPEVNLAEPCVISRNDVVMISIEFLSASIPVKTAARRADYVCLTIMANVSDVLAMYAVAGLIQ
jgi:hypothetical protein